MKKSPRFVESLEGRQLLAAGPRVTSVSADNRGEVQINFNEALSGVSSKRVRMFLAGPDNIVGTADDVNANASVSYVTKRKRIVIKKDLPAGTGYRIRVDDTIVSASTGEKLDGEFKGTKTSGNGVAGGSYSLQAKNDRGIAPIVRMYSNLGAIDVTMFRGSTPANVANFLRYVDSSDNRWKDMLVTRLSRDFVIQGGGLRISSTGNLTTVSDFNDVVTGEPGINSNTKYRMSLALSGGKDSGSNQWFINLTDNSRLDGTFTAFGEVVDSASRAVVDAINSVGTTTAAYLPAPPAPTNFQTLDSIPVTTLAGLTGSNQTVNSGSDGPVQRFVISGGFQPRTHAVFFAKVAQLMRVAGV
jgi:peptidyl-prolyl cis-trans isomerase A (cyclophilin A)